MKKPLKKRIKKWKIGDYARQFSIVTGGVLLTLWLTARITEAAKQREVRQAMQLVASELHDNLQVVRDYRYTYGKDKWVARRLLEADFSLAGFPSDTVETYSRYITGGMGKPYRLSNDALEMLKTTGIASHIADKQTLIDLLRCYKELAAFDDYMELYYDQRMQAMLPSQMENLHWNSPYHEGFEKTLADKTVRNWIGLIPRAFDDWFFGEYEKKLENMILLLEGRYGNQNMATTAPPASNRIRKAQRNNRPRMATNVPTQPQRWPPYGNGSVSRVMISPTSGVKIRLTRNASPKPMRRLLPMMPTRTDNRQSLSRPNNTIRILMVPSF